MLRAANGPYLFLLMRKASAAPLSDCCASRDNRLMAVDVKTEAGQFQAGIPKPLFQAPVIPPSNWRNIYVASPDGQRFRMFVPAVEQAKPAPITVVLNWPALLKKQ